MGTGKDGKFRPVDKDGKPSGEYLVNEPPDEWMAKEVIRNILMKYSHGPLTSKRVYSLWLALSTAAWLGTTPLAFAQEVVPAGRRAPLAENTLLEDVIVTAQKRDQRIQDVPVSMTAFNAEHLDAMKFRGLQDIRMGIPNASFDEIDSSRGVANFSIRGLGINSSIPSLDPTVGMFIDGVYMGTTSLLLFDMFDLESVEVLRGPQGVLFGRNVVGGAVLLNTRAPTDQYEATLRSAVEGGGKAPSFINSATLNAPLTDTLAARVTLHSNQDQGWFKNQRDGKAFGAKETLMLRPIVAWQPTPQIGLTVRYEYQNIQSDGSAAQNADYYNRRGHKFYVAHDGDLDAHTHFFHARLDWDVPFGKGRITDIFAWRRARGGSFADFAGQPEPPRYPLSQINFGTAMETEQFSNELRYVGTFFNRVQLTTGVYYFTNALDYFETRELGFTNGSLIHQFGGGYYEVDTVGLFLNTDYDLTEWLTLTGGLRYTYEAKNADIAYLPHNQFLNDPDHPGCHMLREPRCPLDSSDAASWNSLSPKIGVAVRPVDQVLLYGHWTRGFRSGNYNVRITGSRSVDQEGPSDAEQTDNFELGFKTTVGPRLRINGAVFFNIMKDMQRDVLIPGGPSGVVQDVANTADAEIFGVELDGSYALADQLILQGAVGFLDAQYTDIWYDISGDGIVDGADKALDLIRAPVWTYHVALRHSLAIGSGHRLGSRIQYAYRDRYYSQDNNALYHRQSKQVEVGLDVHLYNSRWIMSLYGKNLLNEANHGAIAVSRNPDNGFGSAALLSKGRIYGLELTYRFR